MMPVPWTARVDGRGPLNKRMLKVQDREQIETSGKRPKGIGVGVRVLKIEP